MGEEKLKQKPELRYLGHLDGAEDLSVPRPVRVVMIGILIIGVLTLAAIWLAYCIEGPMLSQVYSCGQSLTPTLFGE
jgi:hypothetical protein